MSENLDERITQLAKTAQGFVNINQNSRTKIQRVPALLQRNAKFMKYCTPEMISFGPIHHGNEILKQGEYYKLLWTSKFVAKYSENQDCEKGTQVLLKRVTENIEELKKEFADDVLPEGKYDDKYLAWMLFVDGCSLLHFMENIDHQCPEVLNLKLHQLMRIRKDTILLENQLPRRLLEMLRKKEGPKLEFLFSNHSNTGESKRNGTVSFHPKNPKPIHLLDYCRSWYLSSEVVIDIDTYNQKEMQTIPNQQNGGDEHNNFEIHPNYMFTYKSVRDLIRAGIRVIPSENGYVWDDIHFSSKLFSGELKLPLFSFADRTPYFFRNLIAYELCPDVGTKYEFCSFVSFMDSLIDNAEDVKELRFSGVVKNLLGTDEELANLVNELGDDLPTKMFTDWWASDAVAFSRKYIYVKQQIQKHYANKWKTWLAEAYNTHFNSPWTTIAFLAALLILNLTLIQTVFTIRPK